LRRFGQRFDLPASSLRDLARRHRKAKSGWMQVAIPR
jgi:hypothetical protein